MRALRLSLIVTLMLTACATTAHRVDDRLFFGRNIPGGGHVTDAELKTFFATWVTPRFPGYTVYPAVGYWKDAPEESFVLEVVHDGSAAESAKVVEIANAYVKTFRQEAVLRVTSPARMIFYPTQ